MNALDKSTQKSDFLTECLTKVCLDLYSVASSLSDHSKCFTFHTQAFLFITIQIRLLREVFSHVAITARRLHSRVPCLLPQYVSWGRISSRGETQSQGCVPNSSGLCSPVGVRQLLEDVIPGSGCCLGLSNVICVRETAV